MNLVETLTADASVAVKWFIREEDSALAHRLIAPHLLLIAPELIFAECANAARKRANRGLISEEQAESMARRLREPFHKVFPLEKFTLPALAIAREISHPVYDCFYLALAESAGGRVVTADIKFFHAARRVPRLGKRIVLLKEFPF